MTMTPDDVLARKANQHDEALLRAATPEGVAFREWGLHNLERLLLAKTYPSAQERARVLAEFSALAAALRRLDMQIVLPEHESELPQA
jgi:hypothetical protein